MEKVSHLANARFFFIAERDPHESPRIYSLHKEVGRSTINTHHLKGGCYKSCSWLSSETYIRYVN